MQGNLFQIAFFAITLVFLLPNKWLDQIKNWIVFFDAIGLAAFAIQGANYAVSVSAPFIAVIIASTITGAGGGMIRDVFAGRKPMIFHSEIYALWAALAGFAIGLDLIRGPYMTAFLLILIVFLRIISVRYNWNLPHNIPYENKRSMGG